MRKSLEQPCVELFLTIHCVVENLEWATFFVARFQWEHYAGIFLNTLLVGKSCPFTTWFVIDNHFSLRISAFPWQVLILHQKWFVIEGTHWLNFPQPFFFEDADSFFSGHSCRHSIINMVFLIFLFLSHIFLNLGMRVSWNPCHSHSCLLNAFKCFCKTFLFQSIEFFTSQTDTTVKSTTLSLWTSNIVWVPYVALWPGELQRLSPASFTGFPCLLEC